MVAWAIKIKPLLWLHELQNRAVMVAWATKINLLCTLQPILKKFVFVYFGKQSKYSYVAKLINHSFHLQSETSANQDSFSSPET